jgi:transcriptional regulator with XRE-family HTH domain
MDTQITFSEALARLLQKYGLSQRKLAERAGVNYVTINRVLNNYQSEITNETIEKIANGLGCTVEERDELLSAAGRIPTEMETKFGESNTSVRLFRRISKMDEAEMKELLKTLEEQEKNG